MTMTVKFMNPTEIPQGSLGAVHDVTAFWVEHGDTNTLIVDQTGGRSAEFEGRGLTVVSAISDDHDRE